MPLAAGTRLGVFEILAPLGKGGMGEVYRAKDNKLSREVAVKVLPEALTQDSERLARFQREATLLAALNHPHIASIYGLEEADGNPFLVLELAPGENLSDRIRRGPIPVDEALGIARQIAEALEAAHEKGIVHRDLKPSNVKVTPDGQVMVLDFGLAKAYSDDASTDMGDEVSQSPTMSAQGTQAGVILGTAAYMSPEQAKGKPVDKRADIWAFGVLVWEMLTGQRLFAGDSVTDTLAAVLRADIDLETLSRSVPGPLVEVLHRCLERDPDKRLHDIADARLVIQDLETGGWELPTAEAATSRGLPTGLAIGGLIGVALGAATMWTLARQGEPRASRASRFEITIPDAVGAHPAISPDGTRIAYASEGQLWVRELDRLEARVVTGTDGGFKPFWSPDGRSIGFSAEGGLWRVPVEGGTRTLLTNDSLGINGSAVWMPGGRIFFATGDSGIDEVSAVGGDSQEIVRLTEDQTDFHEPDVLPDGKGFLTVVHKTEGLDFGNVTLITAERQTELVNVPGDFLGDPVYSETGHIVYRQQGVQGINGIWAVPFSLDTLEVTGEPFVVARNALSPDVVADTLVYTPDPTIHVNELVWLDRSGRVLETVGEARKGLTSDVTLSPDGRRAAVSIRERQDWNLWMIDLESARSTRVTFEKRAHVFAPAWIPKDNRLAYMVISTSDDRRIMVKRPDSSTEAQLVTQGTVALDFSPDGKYMIFGRSRPGFLQDLWVRDLEAATEKAFAQNDWWDVLPSISPDGRLVAYRSNARILVSRFPEADSEWQIAGSGGYPKWSADGTRLYFFDRDDFMEVAIDPGPPFSALQPVRLFSFRRAPGLHFGWERSFAVDGNGERFLMVRVAGIPPGIVVYQNWLANLDR